jgi:hypothetical protein
MIRFLIALLLFASSTAFAGQGMGPGPGLGATTSVSYLLTEDFTASSAPSGWTNSSATFPGGYMQVINGAYVTTTHFTATGDIYAVAKITLAAGGALPTNYPSLIRFVDSANSNLASLTVSSNGKFTVIVTGASAVVSSNAVVSVGGTIYFKLRFVSATHVATGWSSTDGTTWQYATSCTGTASNNTEGMRYMSASGDSNSTWQYDGVRVAATDINYQ